MHGNILTSITPTLGRLIPDLVLPDHLSRLEVTGIAVDSRHVQPGDIFVALVGENLDGRKFISNAVAAGAIAVFVETTSECKAGTVAEVNGVASIALDNLAGRVSHLAGQCYGNPSHQMTVVGVTGTNGKSTCVSLIAQLFNLTVGKAATVGTLGVDVNGQLQDLGMTTPDPATCQRVLASLVREHVQLVAMEVSSHGLDQSRVSGVKFSAGLFTNISHDHLDYHGNLKQYAAAKQKLFETIGLQSAVINLDDPFAAQMVGAAKQHANVLTYSLLHFVADVYASDIQYTADGVQFHVVTPWGDADIQSPLLGEFNVYNLLAAITVLVASGCEFEMIVAAVPKLVSVPGRMQRVNQASDLMVVVDYAHTPDALAQAIAATRVHTPGNLWVIFGCGGDRDRAKRPVMASVAERYADHIVVTSDNPRTESAETIIAEICAGFSGGGYHTVTDREEAIYFATQSASAGDVILIAGKGHETYQIVGAEKKPFNDVLVAEQALHERASMQANGGAHENAK